MSFVALPPVGATPSAPESGELVIYYRLDVKNDIKPAHGRWRWVYADGRLLTADMADGTAGATPTCPRPTSRWSSGLLEQRLTPEGVEAPGPRSSRQGCSNTTRLLAADPHSTQYTTRSRCGSATG